MFSQITIVTSLAANGSVYDFALSIPVPALPSLFHMEYSAAAHNNFNLASPLCSPKPSSEILVKAVTTANSLTEKPWSLWWYRNLPVWAIVSLVDQRLVASLMGGVWMSCTYFPGTRQFSFYYRILCQEQHAVCVCFCWRTTSPSVVIVRTHLYLSFFKTSFLIGY